MILHTVNKSPYANCALSDCLNVASPPDAILLIEDGVYGAISTPKTTNEHLSCIKKLMREGTRFYALEPDLTARGISTSTLLANIRPIDDLTFVSLASAARAIQSWF